MRKVNLQEYINLLWEKFVIQKQPKSFDEYTDRPTDRPTDLCLYSSRGKTGRDTRCFIGWLAKDSQEAESWDDNAEEYEGISKKIELEISPATKLKVYENWLYSSDKQNGVLSDLQITQHLFGVLQDTHDNTPKDTFSSAIEDNLRGFAEAYALTVPQ